MALIAISARISIVLPTTPVPITMQTLMVFLTGMVLGPVEGAISVAGYVAAIASGQPLDARMLGPAVFAGPTAGYLLAFIPAAFIAGLAWRARERYRLILSIVCGLAAAILILVVGTLGVALYSHSTWGDGAPARPVSVYGDRAGQSAAGGIARQPGTRVLAALDRAAYARPVAKRSGNSDGRAVILPRN